MPSFLKWLECLWKLIFACLTYDLNYFKKVWSRRFVQTVWTSIPKAPPTWPSSFLIFFSYSLLLTMIFWHITPMKYRINTKKLIWQSNFFIFGRLKHHVTYFFKQQQGVHTMFKSKPTMLCGGWTTLHGMNPSKKNLIPFLGMSLTMDFSFKSIIDSFW